MHAVGLYNYCANIINYNYFTRIYRCFISSHICIIKSAWVTFFSIICQKILPPPPNMETLHEIIYLAILSFISFNSYNCKNFHQLFIDLIIIIIKPIIIGLISPDSLFKILC